MKKFLILFTFLFLFILVDPVRAQNTCEVRGTWLNPQGFDFGKEDAMINEVKQAGLNTVFVATPPIGGNNGWGDTSSFGTMIQKSKAAGLSVHAWLYPGSVDYTNTSAQQNQVNWVMALMQQYGQNLDGVHIDMETTTYGNVNAGGILTGLNNTIAKIHAALSANYPGKYFTYAVFTAQPNFASFSSEGVPTWFKNWISANPGSAYGSSSVPQFMKYQEDPIAWAAAGNIDGIMPMQYTLSDSAWDSELSYWKSFLTFNQNSANKLFMGLGWTNCSGCGYDAPGTVRKINYERSLGLSGVVFFELGKPGVDDSPLVSALNTGPYKSSVPSCLSKSSAPPPPPPPPPPPVKPGDYNGDGMINILDLRLVVTSIINKLLTIFDYAQVVDNFGKTSAGLTRNPWGVMLHAANLSSAKLLHAAYYRPQAIALDTYSGSCAECDQAIASGLKLLPDFLATANRGPATDLVAYKNKLNLFLSKYKTEIVTVGGEENASMFYTGTVDQYHAELTAACQVAHSSGIKCMDGGLVSGEVAILVADSYQQQGLTSQANDYLTRTLGPTKGTFDPQQLLADPQTQAQITRGKQLLAGFKNDGADYVNFHWYIADTPALETAVSFLEQTAGLPATTNEMGQQKNTDPAQVTNDMTTVKKLNLPYAVWFSEDITGGGQATALINPDGSLRPNGQAFAAFIQSNYQ